MKKMYSAPSACPIPRSRYGITEVSNGPTIAYAATVITAVGMPMIANPTGFGMKYCTGTSSADGSTSHPTKRNALAGSLRYCPS